ncbi:MAG: adenylyltransferase/cytidyltransferase family protein [Selenomonadaceae bacterium]|nr:adenylyltransferase/cytidyltransferase family protein [Selenomonadaceae bacterium]
MNPALKSYLISLKKECVDYKKIGAIVMNCNPFTRGHRYLIEQALKLVEFLYIFVVEEDSSDFSFKDRFEIVKSNCDDLKNVRVLPSGKYMISSVTFAEYFQKDDLQGQQTMIPSMDIRLFGQAIAPTLNITKRFVGEEPLDSVTRQYNEAMKDMLPNYGIELIEIPRLELNDGEPINATKVRKLILDGDLKSCETYLTIPTYLYIKKNFKRIRKALNKK